MTVIDSSAVIAVLRQEKGADAFLDAINEAEAPRISVANYREASIVQTRKPVASTSAS